MLGKRKEEIGLENYYITESTEGENG